MRLGTDALVVAATVDVCCAELMEANNKVDRARAMLVLKRRMESSSRAYGNGISCLGSKKGSVASYSFEPRTTKVTPSSLEPEGKGMLTPAVPRTVGGLHAEVPCLSFWTTNA